MFFSTESKARLAKIMSRYLLWLLCYQAFFLVSLDNSLFGQIDFEAEPINYNTAPVTNPVHDLQQRMEQGEAKLVYNEHFGYLKAVLEQLKVPFSSQMLVFSKTSFQQRYITPQRPRAIYFNDDVYVGWVQGGEVMEISTADPRQGAIFYTIDQRPAEHPKITRDRGQCIVCHASSRTSGVPGHLVRSVFSSRSGLPYFGSGTFTTDHTSPFSERWGGWYVTGTHGKQRHMGNVIATNRDNPESLDTERGANVTDLTDLVNTEPYLSPHSDLVALMVLEHQTRMHNLITRANFETRSAVRYDRIMNEVLERPTEHRSDSSQRRIVSASEKLVEYMLFVEEYQLTEPVKGTSPFATEFASQGPQDSKGRSLRELDLVTRLMKYPCSYLIYSEPFEKLPMEVKTRVFQRLTEILGGQDLGIRFSHLQLADRLAILEILQETHPEFSDYCNDRKTASTPHPPVGFAR